MAKGRASDDVDAGPAAVVRPRRKQRPRAMPLRRGQRLAITPKKAWGRPCPWASLLPGDPFPGAKGKPARAIPWPWYAHRLGLVEADGRINSRCGVQEQHLALEAYLRAFVDSGRFTDEAKPVGSRALAVHGRRADGTWGWTPPRRGQWWNRKMVAAGAELGIGTVLGQLWRARLFNALDLSPLDLDPVLPTVDLADRVGRRLAREPDGPLADLILGWDRHEYGIEVGTIRPQRLLLRNRDWWWWASAGVERLRAVIVDIDLHLSDRPSTQADLAHLRKRVAFFTSTPGMPRPHLVVASNRGRHLWYLTEERTGPAWNDEEIKRARDLSTLLETRLRGAFGADLKLARMEVFPRSASPWSPLPALPFGPGSALLSQDGMEVEATDPLDAMVLWRRRFLGGSPKRYSAADFRGIDPAGSDPRLVRSLSTPPPSLAASTCVLNVPILDSKGVGVMSAPYPRPSGSTPACSRSACLEVFEGGPTKGGTNDQVPLVARWLRYGEGRRGDDPESEDDERFLAWVRSGDGTLRGGSRSWWLTKLAYWWRYWQRGFGYAYLLYEGDVRWAGSQVARRRHDWPTRKRLLLVLLLLAGRARYEGAGRGWSGPVVVPAREVRDRWTKDFADCRDRLVAWRIVKLAQNPDPGRSQMADMSRRARPGTAAEYRVNMPATSGQQREVRDRAGMLRLVAAVLDSAVGARLAGSAKAWRRFTTSTARKPGGEDS